MPKRFKVFLAALAISLLALLVPHAKPSPVKSFQQHESWPGLSQEVIDLQQDGVFATHLPILILHNDGQAIPGYLRSDLNELSCEWSVIHSEDGVNRLDAAPTQSGRMLISIRGNSSREYPKKQYMMKTTDTAGLPEDVSLLGMPAESSWVLNGSYIDHSLIRNYMMYNLAGDIMEYAPRSRMCEVFTTNANGRPIYQGVYTLMEKIKVSKSRLNLEDETPKTSAHHAETSFVLQMNSWIDHKRIFHLKPDGVNTYSFDLEYPDAALMTQDTAQYIERRLLIFEKALYDAVRTGDWDTLNAQIDMDSFVDYYIINEFVQNLDAGTRSTYLYQNMGGKMAIGPVWDFDGAFNNFADVENRVDYLKLKSTFYYRSLFQNETFVNLCIARYHQLRRTLLSDKSLLDYIDSCAAYLEQPAQRNAKRWYGGEDQLFWDDIQSIKDFIVERGAWMDENFEALCTIVK